MSSAMKRPTFIIRNLFYPRQLMVKSCNWITNYNLIFFFFLIINFRNGQWRIESTNLR
jgi:hypothetical protein